MTSTGKSNTDLIAEAVAAIGPWRAWLGNKRVEIQGQIAQMQVATIPSPTGCSSLATRFEHVGLPRRTSGTADSGALAANKGAEAVHVNIKATVGTSSPHATALEGAGETAHVAQSAIPEEPVNPIATGNTPTSTASLPTLQNQQEAQAYLETVFAATPPHTLPPLVVAAWEGRTADATYNARMLIGAKEAGVLSAELAHAVSAMIAFDSEFGAVYPHYEDGLYKELFDIGLGEHGPTDDEEDQAEWAEDGDTEEGEGDEEEAETEQQGGFPGEDTHERPF